MFNLLYRQLLSLLMTSLSLVPWVCDKNTLMKFYTKRQI